MNNQEVIQILKNPARSDRMVNEFSYFATNVADMKQWLTGLSVLNMAEVSKQIRMTLRELSALSIEEEKRLEFMELLRYAVHNLIISLNRHYLNQSLLLDKKELGIAALVQQLRIYSFKVYFTITTKLNNTEPVSKTSITSFISKVKPSTYNTQTLAIHRAINELGGLLYETKLLYLPIYEGIWQNLNQLYKRARTQNTLEDRFDNSTNNFGSKTSVLEEYMRTILLSMSRTNRLRQPEIKKLYDYSELWAPLIKVNNKPNPNDLFLIDLNKDFEPTYITTANALTNDVIYIDSTDLIKHLEKVEREPDENNLLHFKERELSRSSLIKFVAKSIGEPLERGFARHTYEGSIEISIGLVAAHYHIANRRQFGDVVKIKQINEQENKSEILINKSQHFIGEEVAFQQNNNEVKVDQTHLKTFDVEVVNVSPSGYRAIWKNGNNPALKTGEIICLREEKNKPWQVGIIRWVQQATNVGVEFGIEVLSAKSTACGIKPNRPADADSQYIRAILIPEVRSLNRPATLLTPNFNFVSNHRIKIRVGTQEVIAKLGKECLNTQSFSQYEFTLLSSSKKTYH